MGNVLNSNVSSLNAQRNLTNVNNALQTTFQRLSSGLRINSARDDAAGLQISNGLTSQIRGLTVAARNANDGISLAQVAEGALQESTNILQRIRELSIQSANGSNGASERAALQAEVSQLQLELNRIADSTSFGGRTLLDRTFGSSSFQVGSEAFQTINVVLSSSRGADIGNNSRSLSGTAANVGLGRTTATAAGTAGANNAAGTITIAGSTGTSSAISAVGLSAKEISDAVNLETSTTNVSADARNVISLSGLGDGNVSFTLLGSSGTASTITAGISGGDLTSLSSSINEASAQTGISANIESGAIVLTSERGDDIVIEGFTTTSGTATTTVSTFGYDGTGSAVDTTILTSGASNSTRSIGVVQLNSSTSFTSTSTSTSVDTAGGQTSALVAVDTIDISTTIGAQLALTIIDEAITSIDSTRAQLGAVQNRLSSTISNLQNIVENVSAARSRIRDTDYAIETSNLAKNQVLQQAGLSVLSQANASSQSVLSLLQG